MPLSQHRISSKATNRFIRCTHLRSLNVHHYGIVEANEIKVYDIEVAFNVITSIQNLIQIQESVQKLHHLRTLNVRHFGMVEATALNSMESRSSSMSSSL
jgi:hypothetical protein